MKYRSDVEIAQSANMIEISEVAKKAGFEDITMYGKNKGKIDAIDNPKSKLILVTAINPTPAGEGKTTTTIGLGDAMNSMGYNTVLALREPSLGPVFGRKGGAAGGGMAQVVPMEEINLHFTGDIHAISTANNLISAAIDNKLWFGNEMGIDEITWKRCIDMNERALRNVELKVGKRYTRQESFQITAASEIMAIFALAKDFEDLRTRINNIIFGYTKDKKPLFVKDLNITGSIVTLLQEAFKPNIVQTLENNPVLVHGGPFANIAHGCNSIVATKTAMSKADFVVTEAGFGADLGAEKFLNIKSRIAGIAPNAVVIVATIKALKMQGGASKDSLSNEGVEELKKGIKNLEQHINIIKSFDVPFVVALNHFVKDHDSEVEFMEAWAKENNIPYAVSKVWEFGSKGGKELVETLMNTMTETPKINFTYELTDSIELKAEKIVKNIYGGKGVNFSEEAKATIKWIEENNLQEKPICFAKTPSSLSADQKLLGAPKDFVVEVSRIQITNGSGMIVLYTDKILTLPGLPKKPAAEDIDIVDGKIIGLM